jgi:low temperature requirement protein LtrA
MRAPGTLVPVARLRRQRDDDEARASFGELFFDLVFVLVITQLSALLVHDLTVSGAAETLFLLLAAWWAWIYTTWMTNWFDPETVAVRAVLLVGMLASMIGAIAIPEAFGDRALLLVIGYVGIQTFRNAFTVVVTDRDDPLRKPLTRIFAWSAYVGVIWLVGALVDRDTRVWVWLAALVLDYAGPIAGHWTPGLGRSTPADWELEPSHFVERIELFVIIALGESIVAAGATASGLEPTAARVLALAVGFLVAAAMWWLYFDFHAERALKELELTREPGRLGRDLSYIHVPMVAGIIVAAVANELVIAHPGDRLGTAELVALGAGPVLYLLGSALLKALVLHLPIARRLAAAGLVAIVAAVGALLPALVTWSVVLAVLASLAAIESIRVRAGVVEPPAARR